MNYQRLVGLDLNGVNDWLAEQVADDEPRSFNIGVRGSLVHLLAQSKWVVGKQNERAPHGRGSAWDKVGEGNNRIELFSLLEHICNGEVSALEAQALASAMPALTSDSARVVFAVPDIPEWGEETRERFLRLLSPPRGLRPLLLWRPVAALLGFIAKDPEGLTDDLEVAILSLMASGIHLTTLTLERDEQTELMVPVRNISGLSIGKSFRGKLLIENAQRQLANMTHLSEQEIRTAAWAPWYLAIGQEAPPELIRPCKDRVWNFLPTLTNDPPLPNRNDLPEEAATRLRKAQVILVEGPFAGNQLWYNSIKEVLRREICTTTPIVPLKAEQVAQGCLEAAQRAHEGKPLYFDFLPQIEINALVDDKPQFVKMIAEDKKRVQGGEPFKFRAPNDYAINRGATEFTFWLIKEDVAHPRRDKRELPKRSDRSYPLTVEVSQTPGQGLAQVTITSSSFEPLRREPFVLDWATMKEDQRPPNEILDEIRNWSRLSFPATNTLPGHPIFWNENGRNDDLLSLLDAYCDQSLIVNGAVNEPAWELLKKLRKAFDTPRAPARLAQQHGLQVTVWDNCFPLNSDGQLPQPIDGISVPANAEELLNRTLAKLDMDLELVMHTFGHHVHDALLRDIVGFATWCFWRCPCGITSFLFNVYRRNIPYKVHWQLLGNGVARTVGSSDRLKHYFESIRTRFSLHVHDTQYNRENCDINLTIADISGIARTLGTVSRAADYLDDLLASRLLTEAYTVLQHETGRPPHQAYSRKFRSAMLMCTVLLRYRFRVPDFLDPDSKEGKRLLKVLDDAKTRNEQLGNQNRSFLRKELRRRFAIVKQGNYNPKYIEALETIECILEDDREFASAGNVRLVRQNRTAFGDAFMKHLTVSKRLEGNIELLAELQRYVHRSGRDPNIIRKLMQDE